MARKLPLPQLEAPNCLEAPTKWRPPWTFGTPMVMSKFHPCVRVRVKVNLGHLKNRFRQAEFTFREVSLTAFLVKASQIMISASDPNRDTQTNRCTHQHTHRHTQTYKHIIIDLDLIDLK